jgi:hypothetical protein
MGTRAGFWLGKGEGARVVGAIWIDGSPRHVRDGLRGVHNVRSYRAAVQRMMRRNARPSKRIGFDDVSPTALDYHYTLSHKRLWVSEGGHRWVPLDRTPPSSGAWGLFPWSLYAGTGPDAGGRPAADPGSLSGTLARYAHPDQLSVLEKAGVAAAGLAAAAVVVGAVWTAARSLKSTT